MSVTDSFVFSISPDHIPDKRQEKYKREDPVSFSYVHLLIVLTNIVEVLVLVFGI